MGVLCSSANIWNLLSEEKSLYRVESMSLSFTDAQGDQQVQSRLIKHPSTVVSASHHMAEVLKETKIVP